MSIEQVQILAVGLTMIIKKYSVPDPIVWERLVDYAY